MLMLFSKQIAELPMANLFPFRESELGVILHYDLVESDDSKGFVFFVLRDIRDPEGYVFSIKKYMEETSVFNCKSFENRLNEFVPIFKTRLDRFFGTKRSDHIFFDGEEQKFIHGVFNRLKLTAIVDIYLFDKESGERRLINFDNIEDKGYNLIRHDIERLGLMTVIKPGQYHKLLMLNKRQSRAKAKRGKYHDYVHRADEKEKNELDFVFSEYPDLNVNSKAEFKKAYRKLAQAMHPDKNQDDDKAGEKFAIMQERVSRVKKTHWYKSLKDGDVDG